MPLSRKKTKSRAPNLSALKERVDSCMINHAVILFQFVGEEGVADESFRFGVVGAESVYFILYNRFVQSDHFPESLKVGPGHAKLLLPARIQPFF